jgi:hypothetical protein
MLGRSQQDMSYFPKSVLGIPAFFVRIRIPGSMDLDPDPTLSSVTLKVVTNEKGEAVGEVLTII